MVNTDNIQPLKIYRTYANVEFMDGTKTRCLLIDRDIYFSLYEHMCCNPDITPKRIKDWSKEETDEYDTVPI